MQLLVHGFIAAQLASSKKLGVTLQPVAIFTSQDDFF